MIRFQIDKFITYVEATDEQVRRYAIDPAGYVAEWVQRGAAARTPIPDGGPLSPAARDALSKVDYAALYRMGAHPYVLWHFTEAVLVWAGDLAWAELKEQFRAAVAGAGYPDFAT